MGAGADRGPALSAQVGPYALVGALGRGGTATVFRARGPRGEECALKLLERRDDAGRQRFLREAQVLAELSHPALVPLRGAGEHQGVLYLAMPFLGGGTLSQRVAARGPLASRDAAELLQSLADGVAYAHDHGVLHRDVKPDNVLFERDGAARLGDFGLARRTDPGATRLSRTGAIQGTPGFWAPEQASGGATGPWTDVYGLGATLYFALTGLAPHAGESLVELLRAVEQLEVEPPSRHVPDVDPALEAVCLRCLAKRPEQRFASARELERALGRVVRGEAPRPGARRWPWVLALVGCLGVAALAVARWPRDEPPVLETSEPDLGSARVELEGGDPVAALAALDALPDPRHPRALRLRVDALLRLGDQDAALATSDELLAATPNDPVARVQRARIELDRGARDAAAAELARARELSGGAETEAFAALRRRIEALPEDPRRALDALYAETRRDPRSVEAWLRLLDGLEHDVPRLLEALDQALGHLPDAPALIRRRARARAALGRAEAALEDFKRLEIVGQLRVDDLARLSVVHQLLQDWPQATRWAERAVATDPRHPEGWTELGMTYFSRGDLPVARAALTHAFALDPRDPRARASLAQVCHGCEDFAHSVALFELTLAGDAPEEFAVYLLYGRGLAKLGRLEEAEAALNRALELGPEHAATVLGLRGMVRVARGAHREASQDLRRALSQGPGDPALWLNLATAQLGLGQPQRTLDSLARCEHVQPSVRNDPEFLRVQASALLETGQLEQARAALRVRCDLLPDEGGGHYDYARLCRRLGDSEAALAAARRAWELLPGDDEVVELLQSLLDGVGELEAFADLVGDLLQVHPDEHWLRGFLAERLMSAGHPDVAEAVLDELVRRAPRSVAGHLQRAQVRVARDDLAGARADFSRVLELRPEDVAARQNRGLVCLQQGALVDALHDFARALREGRDTLDVRMGLAQTLGILGRRLEARQYLGDYLRRHPREAQADVLEFLLRELR